MLKQFGINLGAAHQLRQLHDRAPDRERAAAHGRRRPRHAARSRHWHGRLDLTRRHVRDRRHALQLRTRGRRRSLRQLRRRPATSHGGNTQHHRRAARARARRSGPHAGRAQPDRRLGRDRPSSWPAASIPIPVVDSDGKLSVIFKEFGVGLAFTPVVLSEGRISLKIETEVSELTNEGAVVLSSISASRRSRSARPSRPSSCPRAARWRIAGLISDDTRQNIDGFPGLKDVPVLGTLFRSRDYIKQETELVVIVTPYMVRPTARQNLARPDDGLAARLGSARPTSSATQPDLRQGPGAAAGRPEGRLRVHRRIAGKLEDAMRSPIAPPRRFRLRPGGSGKLLAASLLALALAGCKTWRSRAPTSPAGPSIDPVAAPSDHGVAAAGDHEHPRRRAARTGCRPRSARRSPTSSSATAPPTPATASS